MQLRLLSLILLGLLCTAARALTLQQEIDGLIQKHLPNATTAVLVKEALSGKVIYSRGANKLLSPASTTKLLTALAAITQLGPEFRYTTMLSKAGNNLYLTFTGSPAFDTTALNQLFNALNHKTIKGNLIIDASLFKAPFYARATSYDDLGWYFAAPSSAIMLNGNQIAYEVFTSKTLGQPITLIPTKRMISPLTIENHVTTVSLDDAKHHCDLELEIKSLNTLHLYGCLAKRERPYTMQFAISDPYLYAKELLSTILKQHQIQLQGHIVQGNTPKGAEVIASHQSDTLPAILKHMLEESDNLYADSLTKRLGDALYKQGSYKEGAYAIKTILGQIYHLDPNSYVLTDGAGSRYNLISATFIVNLLENVYHHDKLKALFLSSLPVMGMSGTLKSRMKGTLLRNHVFAKTGSMHDISALSGYLKTKHGMLLIFSIISNDVEDLRAARALEEDILLRIF
jgi:D-alanyl-D-alanine carboxypeptidase/D-alanyl-D-alanine-endopeptidase (penicillin-binding protein 4)